MAKPALTVYRTKRDFSKTAEPTGEHRVAPSPRLRFVVQKHAARQLHYDFRLEWQGVFKSWAVARGPSLDPADKRLAVEVEDHPLDYGDFEGTIPKGEYGGGTVMIWDTGTYELVEGNDYKGFLHIHLSGAKLKGDWVLIKDKDKERNWYLMKVEDSMKPLSAKNENASAVSGRTMEQIARDRDRNWHSNRVARV